MSHETSKSMRRRYFDGAFHSRFFVGAGIDIGAGPDGASQYVKDFRGITSIRDWDMADGDALALPGIAPESYDFAVSSHCLEHLNDPFMALRRWIEVVKPGGHLILTLPDEDLYESGKWPSAYGEGHQWSFTVHKRKSPLPKSVNVLDLVMTYSDYVSLERLNMVRDFYNGDMIGDQTRLPNTECAIELVLLRRAK